MTTTRPPVRFLAFLLSLLVAAAVCAAPAGDEPSARTVPHLHLEVRLDPATQQFRATAQLTTPGAITFALHESLTVQAVHADGKPVDVTVIRRHGNVRLWRIAAQRGAQLRIRYGGTLPALDQTLNAGEVLRAMPPMASRRGSYLPAGSAWYPRPAQLFTYRVTLSLPGDQRGLVAGRPVSEQLADTPGERYKATFEFAHPARSITLMAGPYDVREMRVPRPDAPPLRLRTYFYPGMGKLAAEYLEASRDYINLYSQWIGTYPFAGFSVVASSLPTGFGMPTLTYLGRRVLRLPFIINRSLGHEVLHNWWGNGVYIDYASGNWAEGLTTFMADYFYQTRKSAAAARHMRLKWLRNFAAIPAGDHLSLAAFRSRTHGAGATVGYNKAAMVFLMLRDLIGRDSFDRGIRLFWQRNRFRVASWNDLRTAFEDAAGRSLKTFFRQWLQRVGGPRIDITATSARRTGGKVELTVTLTQSKPPYLLQVPVQIVGDDHAVMRRVKLDRARRTVTLELDWVPEGVRLDPNFRLWRQLDPDILPPILRQWIVASEPRLAIVSSGNGFTQAARMLAGRLFEAPVTTIKPAQIEQATIPVLVIGRRADINATLATMGLAPRPPELSDDGTAQVWTVAQQHDGPPIAIISVRDTASLQALFGPLPHYGNESWLIFDGGNAVRHGAWPVQVALVPISRPRSDR